MNRYFLTGCIVSGCWMCLLLYFSSFVQNNYKEIREEYYELGVRHGIRSGIEDYIPATDTTPTGLCNCLLVATGHRNKKTGEFLDSGDGWEEINLDSITIQK